MDVKVIQDVNIREMSNYCIIKNRLNQKGE